MAAKQKYDTLEQVVEATGIELNEKTRPFLESFVKKATGASDSATAKKKDLLEKAAMFGVKELDPEKENVSSILVRIISHLFEEGRLDEMKEFATAHSLYVTDTGSIHRIRQAVKPIAQRNAGVKEGSVGYNTIQLLKRDDLSGLTAAEISGKLAEEYGQTTNASCVQWYINYCHKKVEAINELIVTAQNEGKETTTLETEREKFAIVQRVRSGRTRAAAAGGGVVLGAELTLDKALKPKGFAKKNTADAGLGEAMDLEGAGEEVVAEQENFEA